MSSKAAAIRSHRDLLDSLWDIGASPLAAAALVGLLALTLAAAAVLPQEPPGLAGAAQERWLADASAGAGALGPALRLLGFFNLLSGPWCRVLLLLLAYHLLLRLADQLRSLRPAPGAAPVMPPPPPDLPSAPLALDGSWNAVVERAGAALSRRYRVLGIVSTPETAAFYAERGGAGRFGLPLAYLGTLCFLLGLAVNSAAGWDTGALVLAPGGSAEITPAKDLQVHLQEIGESRARAVSTLAVTRGSVTHRGAASYTRPFQWGNLWIAQRATGPALAVSAQDANGRPVVLERGTGGGQGSEQISIPFTPADTEQTFAAPALNVVFRVVSYLSLPEQGYRGPVFLIEAYRGDDPARPILAQLVENEATLPINNLTFTLRRAQYAVLEAAYVPGLILLAPGGLVGLAGLILFLWSGRTRAWLNLAPRDAAVAAEVRVWTTGNRVGELRRLEKALAEEIKPHAD